MTASALNSLAAYQSEDDGNYGDDQKNVNQRTCAVHKESKRPCDHEDHSNNIK